ncbi:MAG: hypothetical protein ACJ75S_02630 [Solirubrobacterales bacterium]
MAEDASREIEWSAARVNDEGSLSVPLRGEWDDDWNASFSEALGHRMRETRGGVWGEVSLIRDAVIVKGVESDSVDALRAFLESIVANANADVGRRKQAKAEAEAAERAEAAEHAASQEALTEKFRSFGDE